MSAADTTAILSSRSATAASGCTIKNAGTRSPERQQAHRHPKIAFERLQDVREEVREEGHAPQRPGAVGRDIIEQRPGQGVAQPAWKSIFFGRPTPSTRSARWRVDSHTVLNASKAVVQNG